MRITTRHIFLTTSQFAQYNVGYRSDKLSESVDKSSPEALSPKASPRDPGILNNAKTDCTDKVRKRCLLFFFTEFCIKFEGFHVLCFGLKLIKIS
jgi:hypothetical protein